MATVDYVVLDDPVPRLEMVVTNDDASQVRIFVDPLAGGIPLTALQTYYDSLTVKTAEYCDELASNYFNPSTLTYLIEIVRIRASLFSTLGIDS